MRISAEVNVNNARAQGKLNNERMGRFVAHEWKRLINPYTPRNTGNLIYHVDERPFELWYRSPYAHYMYEGIVYADPVTGAAGFKTDNGWRSRYGVTKVPTARRFNYNRSMSPYATDHWDAVAARSGQLSKLYRAINNHLQ